MAVKILNGRTATVPIDSIKPHPRNVNRGDSAAIEESIVNNGFYGSLIVQRSTGHILAGTHRWRAAKGAGLPKLPVTYVDVDDRAALRIMLADNRTSRLGLDEPAELAALLQEIRADSGTLLGTAFTDEALGTLLQELGLNSGLRPGVDVEEEPPLPEKVITREGDLICIGRHRLLCGDARSFDHVERLLGGAHADMAYCDPPYGVEIVSEAGTVSTGLPPGPALRRGKVGGDKPNGLSPKRGKVFDDSSMKSKQIIPSQLYAPIIGDDSTQTAIDTYSLVAALKIPVQIFWGGNYYADALPPSSCWIVWDKDNGESFFADAELAWTNQKTAVRIFKHTWNGLIKASERGQRRVHPTQKPVALAEWCFEKYGSAGDNVLDLFGGSGPSLMACEKTNRTAYLMELSPAYCDVMVTRWQNATGRTAERP